MMHRYRAGRLLWHSKEERYIQPGQPVDVSHLTPDERMMLETMNPPAIVAEKAAKAAQPAPGSGQEG